MPKPIAHCATYTADVAATHVRLRFGLFALLCAFAVLLVCAPGQAFAKSYSISKVNIAADVQSDASLHVVEQRTFDLSGTFTSLQWNLRSSDCTVNSVQIGTVSETGDTSLSDLSSVGFDLNWREDERPLGDTSSIGPGGEAYSVDTGRNELYTFFDATDQQIIVQVDYTIKNGATAYRDCADLYWQYIGTDWKADSHDVTCTVSLPVPAGVQPTVGNMVYAWGHGPANGTLTFNDSDTVITYHSDCVPAGSFAEARVVFPRSWLVNISSDALKTSGNVMFKDQIIASERKWVDTGSWQRHYAYLYLIVMGAISAALLLYTLVMLLRYAKGPKNVSSSAYWRDEPHRGVHPAVIGRLYRENRESPKDFIASVVHLANIGAITVSRGSYAAENGQIVAGYYLDRVPSVADKLDNPIDRQTIDLLFGTVAEGRNALWLDTLRAFGECHPQKYVEAVQAWQKTLASVTAGADYFDARALRRQRALAITGVLYALFSLFMAYFTGNYPPLAFMLPTAALLFAASNYMPHLTRQGARDLERCRALKRWFERFPDCDDVQQAGSARMQDLAHWKSLLVYAYEFGVSGAVVKKLRSTAPELFNRESQTAREEDWYVPWFAFYEDGWDADSQDDPLKAPHADGSADGASTLMASVVSALEDVLKRTQRAMEQALSSDRGAVRTDEPDALA